MRRQPVELTGRWDAEEFDAATGRTLWSARVENAATLAGLTAMLQDFFAGGTQKTAWYIGLIDGSGYAGVSEDDTMSSHPGWTEATAYLAPARPQWTPLAVASGLIANSSQVALTATAAMTLRGFFLASDSAKGGTAGTLWSTALFGTARTLAAGNGFRLTYTVAATGGNP